MSHSYLDFLKRKVKSEQMTADLLLELVENTDFFFKTLKIKFESNHPELKKQIIEEIKELKSYLLQIQNS